MSKHKKRHSVFRHHELAEHGIRSGFTRDRESRAKYLAYEKAIRAAARAG